MLLETDRVYTRRRHASAITSDIKHSNYLALYCSCHFVSCWRLSGARCSKRDIHIWCLVRRLSPWTSKSYAVTVCSICAIYHLACCLKNGISFSTTPCTAHDIVFTLGVIRKNIIFVLLIKQAAGYTFSGKKSWIQCSLFACHDTEWLLKVKEYFVSEENEKGLSGMQSKYVWIETLRNSPECHFPLNSENSSVCNKVMLWCNLIVILEFVKVWK